MFKLLSIVSLITQCCASYGGVGGGGLEFISAGGAIPAAVRSIWRLHVRPVQLQQEQIQPQVIEVPALELPVKILFHSKSSGVFVQQVHQPGEPGQSEATRSEEEPHKLFHEVVRPVIQELRETIVPYRRVVQEITPVVEEVETIVARGVGRQNTAQTQGGGVLPSLSASGGVLGLSNGGIGLSSGGLALSGGLSSFNGDGRQTFALMGSGLGGFGLKSLTTEQLLAASKSSAVKKS